MKSRKQVKLAWAIVQALYIIFALFLTLYSGWQYGAICLSVTSAYTWGWYRCWCFHKIGWEEGKSEPEKPISGKEVRARVTHSWYCNKCETKLNHQNDVRHNDSVCPHCGHMSQIGFPIDIHRRLDKSQ